MIGTCVFCERENIEITLHHLIPKVTHSKKKIRNMSRDLKETVHACEPCHSHIHATFSEKELAEKYNSVKLISEQKEISTFIRWIRTKPIDLKTGNNLSNRRRERR